VLIVVLATLVISALEKLDFFTNFSSVLSCIGNVGFNVVGTDFCYGIFSPVSQILLSFIMLLGRLEIFPLLLLFMPRTWRKA
jgi:trk system potassium uptake protein TrkH